MNTGRAGAVRIVTLDQAAEVLPGFSIHGAMEHDVRGTHQVVITRHLTGGEPYRYHISDELRVIPGRDTRKYEVRAGDVLFMSRGTRNLAWSLAEVPRRTIAPVSFYILRPHEGTEPEYLAWYLNQPPAQQEIDRIRTGAGTPIVQRHRFAQVEIVLPPLDQQREISALGSLLAHEAGLLAQLSDATMRRHALIGKQIIDHLRPDPQAPPR